MTRLYESAAGLEEPRPLWHVGPDRAFFAGPLGHNVSHSHATPVLLTGLYGTFRLRIGGGAWRLASAAIIPAGTRYEFDMGGEPLSVLYLEPDLAGTEALLPILQDASGEEDGVVVGRSATLDVFRELFESSDSQSWAQHALSDLVSYAHARAHSEIDPRVAKLVRRLSDDLTEQIPAESLAAEIGLSVSRMQHLFAETVGVPVRRYRTWRRLRSAISEAANGSNGTAAAHAAGFFDQSHFVHAFRRAFGAPPRLAGVRGN
ncbi:Transcriptional activator FeaR [Methyloligella halotolerans]|uniref:Transcriptional activator FeaR n=1 Tax=Methyloligella halotolerans TaxID=1177755 RepID=A0A1E2RYZ0_9HYPH|nr:AraC family transcriptional regulator [Methyloligella halotolerans]ODA67431.1 Transcriptional activator FeaR [Methyloligella halotolerans]